MLARPVPVRRLSERRAHGFTLIELMVTLALFAMMMLLAMPAFSTWINNTKVRTTADALQNGLRLAQTEAIRRSRQVTFKLNGNMNWSIDTVPLASDEKSEPLETGSLGEVDSAIKITATANTVCFNSLGRLVANAASGCTLPTTPYYQVQHAGADRNLKVLLALGGQIRLCDPARPTTAPDGCPL